MKERPILFAGDMVRAILDGRKTQTRRIVKPQPKVVHASHSDGSITTERIFRDGDQRIHCPYGKRGDRLWVKETHYINDGIVAYRVDGEMPKHMTGTRWRPSIHMPRWASRITLEIADVRVQRVQEITDGDVIADGLEMIRGPVFQPRQAFSLLWDSIYAKRGHGWRVNPWVWVIEFRKIK